MHRYSEKYYRFSASLSRESAQKIVPLFLEFFPCSSVIDVGCGLGAWLAAFQDQGVAEIQGIDGPWINPALLMIPEDSFLAMDLTAPVGLEKRYDAVVSLEVAEHLPPESAESFVDYLTSLGPVVMFSAAIPFQGGESHLNLQWPEYWAKLFRQNGYVAVDMIRRRIWSDPDIAVWHVQNLIVFVESATLESSSLLRRESQYTFPGSLSLIHPRTYLDLQDRLLEAGKPENISLARILSALPGMMKKSLLWRLP